MKQFTIIREMWLRGDDGDQTFLLDDMGRRCCLGFYLQACGLTDEELQDVAVPAEVKPGLPEEARWLRSVEHEGPGKQVTRDSLLMEANDGSSVPEDVREESIVELFKEQGIEVLFVDA